MTGFVKRKPGWGQGYVMSSLSRELGTERWSLFSMDSEMKIIKEFPNS